MGIEAWSTTPASNNDAPPAGAPEGMAPSTVNNVIRQQMADHRAQWNDAQWFEYGDGDGAATVTYVAATQFKVEGVDVSAVYQVGRRVKIVAATPGTIYGTITAVSFSTDTTVTVAWDSGSLSNEAITSAELGIMSPSNPALPFNWSDTGLVFSGAADGGDTSFTIRNTAASGSTNETATLKFEHVDGNGPGGKIISSRATDYTSDANEDSFLTFYVAINGTDTERLRISTAGGLFLSDFGNANNSQGATFNQRSADDEILSFQANLDIDHGRTGVTETDTFGFFKKVDADEGGLNMTAMGEDASHSVNMQFNSYGGTADTNKTTASRALVEFDVKEISGNTDANITANGNVFVVRARVGGSVVSRIMVDEDGDFYSVTAAQTFDEHDDIMACRAYDMVRGDVIRSEWDKFVQYNEQQLIDMKVLGGPVSGMPHDSQGMTNMSQLQRLHNGAIVQLNHRDLFLMQLLEDHLPGITAGMQAKLAAAQMPRLPV